MVKNTKLNLHQKLFCYFTFMSSNTPATSANPLKFMHKPVIYSALIFVVLFVFSSKVNAQYFYKDIWSNRQVQKQFTLLKSSNLKNISIKSFEDDGQPSDGFYCEKKINKNYTQSQMISKSNITGQSLLVSDYDDNGLLVKTTDDTPTTTSVTQYQYDDEGRLVKLTTVTKADDDSEGIVETHEYSYDSTGKLLKMLRKKNNVLVSTITFVSDPNGNIIEEDAAGNNTLDKKYYYYYDDKNRLTDVVHYNEKAGRLLPNYMFEYNSLNQPSQMITTEEGNSNYFIWRYTYNDKDLRATEKCFSKERRLLGTIEYQYN